MAIGTQLQRLSNHIRFLLTFFLTVYNHEAQCDSLENESGIMKARKPDFMHKLFSFKKFLKKSCCLHIQANAESAQLS